MAAHTQLGGAEEEQAALPLAANLQRLAEACTRLSQVATARARSQRLGRAAKEVEAALLDVLVGGHQAAPQQHDDVAAQVQRALGALEAHGLGLSPGA